MVYPADETMTSYFVIDPDEPVICQENAIPYHPKVNEVVRVKNGRNSSDLAIVKQVHDNETFFGRKKFQAVRGSCRHSILSRMTYVKVLCSVPYR